MTFLGRTTVYNDLARLEELNDQPFRLRLNHPELGTVPLVAWQKEDGEIVVSKSAYVLDDGALNRQSIETHLRHDQLIVVMDDMVGTPAAGLVSYLFPVMSLKIFA